MGEVSKEASCEMSPAKLKEKRIEGFDILPLFFTFLLMGRVKCVYVFVRSVLHEVWGVQWEENLSFCA